MYNNKGDKIMENTIRELLVAGMSPEDIYHAAAKLQAEANEAKEQARQEALHKMFSAAMDYMALIGHPEERTPEELETAMKIFDKLFPEQILPFLNGIKTETHEPIKVKISANPSSPRNAIFEELLKEIAKIEG
jgi:hypothetical protein